MPILVPRSITAQSKQPSTAPSLRRCVGLWEVSGTEAEVADIVHALGSLRRSDVIRLIAWLLPRIDTEQGIGAEFQLELARRLLDAELFESLHDVTRKLANEPWVVFHRQALWYLLQFAVVCCREETEECPEQKLQRTIGRCCLMASDCLDQAEADFPPQGSSEEEIDEACVNMVLSIREVSSNSNGPELLARGRQLWFEIPADAALQQRAASHGISIDFDAVFKGRFGVTLREFQMITTICYAFFWGQANNNPRLLDVEEYFGKENATDLAANVLPLISQTPGELAKKLVNEPRQSWSRDFTPLRRYPILRVLPAKFACPEVSFLCRMLADGVYWLLVDAYGQQSSQFKTLFGDIFEVYTNKLISQFGYGGTVLARTFYPSPLFSDSNDQVSDCILHWPKTAVVAEYKAGLLTPHQKYSGRREVLFKAIDDLLMRHSQVKKGKGSKKGIGQLADSLGRIIDGETVRPSDRASGEGPDLAGCTLLPMIVTYDQSLGMHPIQRRAQRKLAEILSAKGTRIDQLGPVLLLTVDDIELLQELQTEASIEEILLDYAKFLDRNPRDRIRCFRDFAYNRFPQHRSEAQSFLKENVSRVFEEVINELKRYQSS